MYPSEPTQTEIFNDIIKNNNKPETLEEMIIRYIKAHQKKIPNFEIGQKYYDQEPDIIREPPSRDATGQVDPLKPDERLITNFHANLVDQKVSYLVGKPIEFKYTDNNVIEQINLALGSRFDDKLHSVLTGASNKGIEWIHPYIDEEGELKFFRVPAEQAVPIWKDREHEKLEAFIRFYKIDNDMKVEYWDETFINYYIYDNGSLIRDYSRNLKSQETHFSTGSWGRIPFIPFKNNDAERSDLFMYKTQIDAYNRRLSDTANMFKESNELIYVLTNYDDTDLSEFKRNMRHYGAIKVSNVDGGVDTIEIKVPVENTEKYLKMLYENIMLFGQAVDFSSDKFGSAPSGVALEFLYTNLNLKADKLARKTKVAIQELLWYVIEHHNLKVNHKEIDISFNYNKVANTELQVQMAQSSMGVVSHETVIENHPFVEDLEAELERIQNERYELNKQLPSITGESDEQQEQHRDNNTE
ncbi:phage portal protein [Staphylococcus saprophyticus]|uniref:phage portal protein n=1 Tax=Staphylococcus saprophyticus TaxID=29385 RepID=UPI001980B6F4|nr:phage portal protein [Staphylococcus saprophyticus]MBN6091267.1 phage portal protein [Staphylococcus saprophyticus]